MTLFYNISDSDNYNIRDFQALKTANKTRFMWHLALIRVGINCYLIFVLSNDHVLVVIF